MEAEEGTTGTDGYDVEFNFENESLKHRIGNTMRSNMYEVRKYICFLIYCFTIVMDKYSARKKT